MSDMDDCEYFTDPQFEYEPTHFLKCHSSIKGDKNDRITKVWMCAFEPHMDFPERTTDLVATCGSNSVCVINVKDGSTLMKYYAKQSEEIFFTLAWSSVFMKELDKKKKQSILAVAGSHCNLHLLHPFRKTCFFQKKIKRNRRKVSINSLQFHPVATSVLCVAYSNGEVLLYDVGEPSLPDYVMNLTLLHSLSIENQIFQLAFSRQCSTLLAATDNGVVGWALQKHVLHDSNSKIKVWRFNFPAVANRLTIDDQQFVDSVESIQPGKMVASKCVLSGKIMLWDLEEAIEDCGSRGTTTVRPAHILKYSDSDNYYMSMGSAFLSGLLTCGDDKGNIWLYDLKKVLSQSHDYHEQSAVIPWPIVEDVCIKKMVELDEIVINKVVADSKGRYIVAVTNTNLVCVWKRDQR